MLKPEVDAQARSGCSSQKWMLEPEVDARARSGCKDWMIRQKVKITKERIGLDSYILWERLI